MRRSRRSRRPGKLLVLLVLFALILQLATQSASRDQLVVPAFALPSFRELLSHVIPPSWGVLPVQQSGTPDGRAHHVAISDTMANQGVGKPPGEGIGELPLDEPAKSPSTKGLSKPKPEGYNAKTSVRDAAKSSETMNHYRNADGSASRSYSQVPVNYRDEKGAWQPIDTNVQRGNDGRWHEKANSHKVSFAAVSTDAALASLALDEKHGVSFGIRGAAKVEAVARGSEVTYPGVFRETDLVLSTTPAGVKESIVLHSASAGTSWDFPLRLNGLTAKLKDDGSVELVDGAGEVRRIVPKPFAFDSKVDQATGQATITHDATNSLVTVDGEQVLRVTLSKAWLAAAERKFPVVVDPSFDMFPSTTFVQSGNPQYDWSGQSYLRIGRKDAGGTTKARSLIKLPMDFANTGIRVDSANLALNNTYSASCGDESVLVSPLLGSWDARLVDWPGPDGDNSIGSWRGKTPKACANSENADYSNGDSVIVPLNPSYFQKISDGQTTNHGLMIWTDEERTSAWKVFSSGNVYGWGPHLWINFQGNIPPMVDRMWPSNGMSLQTLTPWLFAVGHDGDNAPSSLKYLFQVYDSSSNKVAESGLTASDTWVVPDGKLSYGKSYFWAVQTYDGQYYSSDVKWNMFTASVPQQPITSALSQNPGKRGFDPSIQNYTTSATDAEVAGAGPALAVVRNYNSRDPRRSGAFGVSWSSLFDAKAAEVMDPFKVNAVGGVTVTYPEGADVGFGKNPDGTFSPPSGRFATLKPVSGGGYSLTDKNGTTYVFAQDLGSGSFGITSVTDPNNRALTVQWAGGRIMDVTSAVSGRALHLTWHTPAGAAAAHVSKVTTDPANAGDAGSALTWTYNYTGDQLDSVCPPGTTTECTKYGYTPGSQHSNQVLDYSPKSYWPLAETTGTAARSAVVGNMGSDTATYRDVTLGQPGSLPGSSATSAGFNGTSSYVKLPHDISSGSFQAISMWFKTTATDQALYSYSSLPVSAKETTGYYTPALYIGKTGHLNGQFWMGDANRTMRSSVPVNDGNWHHVVMTGYGSMQALVIDGVHHGYLEGKIAPIGNQGWNFIGAGFIGGTWPDSSYTGRKGNIGFATYFNGSIANVAFYDTGLHWQQFGNIYNAGKYPASLLSSITSPSGAKIAGVTYDPVSSAVTQVVDNNNGTWKIAAPTVSGNGQVYRSTVMGSGPTAFYRLAESAGAEEARSEVAYSPGRYSNVTLGVPGVFGDVTAAEFNGSTSWVTVPKSAIKAAPAATVALTFKTTKTGQILLGDVQIPGAPCAGFGQACKPILWVGTNGLLYGSIWTTSGVPQLFSTKSVNDGNWHLATLSASATNQSMYLDGVLQASKTTTALDLPENSTLTIGTGTAGWGFYGLPDAQPAPFTGSIADVAFYPTAFTADDVKAHLEAVRDGSKTIGNGAYPTTDVQVTDPGGKTLTYQYDLGKGGRKVVETDGIGGKTTFAYDTKGFLKKTIDPNGMVTTSGHDVRGNVVSQTTCQNQAANKCSTAYYTYYPDATSTQLTPDPRNDVLLTVRDGRSANATDPAYLTSYSYDAKGNKTGVTTPPVPGHPSGRTTTITYSDGTAAFPATDNGNTPAGLPVRTTSPGSAVNTVAYYKNGDVASTTNAIGLLTRLGYDNLGRMTSQTVVSDTFPNGLVTSYAYDGRNQLLTQTDPTVTNRVTGARHSAVTTNVYNADGNLTSQTVGDATGGDAPRTVMSSYNVFGQRESSTDANQNTTRYSYDSYGNKTSQKDPDGTETVWTFDANGHELTQTIANYTGSPLDPHAPRSLALTSRAYDPGGRLASLTDAMGYTTKYTYLDNGLQATATKLDAEGKNPFVIESRSYDAAGNITGKVTNNGATNATSLVDAANRVTSTSVDPTGANRATSITYTADDKPLSVTQTDWFGFYRLVDHRYDAMGNAISKTTRAKVVSPNIHGHDSAGRPFELGVLLPQDLTPAITTSMTLDKRGLPLTTTDANQAVTSYSYDEAGHESVMTAPLVAVETRGGTPVDARPATYTGYNTFGEVAERQDANGRVTTTVYDAEGQVASVTKPDYIAPGTTNPITATTVFTYDKLGNLKSQSDPLERTTEFVHDQLGELVRTINPNRSTVDLVYSLNGEKLAATDATGAKMTATYDHLGRPLTVTNLERFPSPVVSTTTRSYAASDTNPGGAFLASSTSAAGVITRYGYDKLGQTASITDGAGNTSTLNYNFDGKTWATKAADGSTTVVSYGPTGDPVLAQRKDSAGNVLSESSATYDGNGNKLTATDARKHTTTFAYNALGKITKLVQPVSGAKSTTTTFGYDSVGSRTRFTNGREHTWITEYNSWNLEESVLEPSTSTYTADADRRRVSTYDKAGQLIKQVLPGGVTVTAGYDVNGNIKSQTGAGAAVNTATREFDYDANGRVTSAKTAATGDGVAASQLTFAYNDRGGLLSTTGSAGASSFEYTLDGQMAARTDKAGATRYTYDTAGRLDTLTDAASGTKSTYRYNNLNQVKQIAYGTNGNVRTFGYDGLQRLTSDRLATAADATIASIGYGYDPNNNLTSKTSNGFGGAASNTYTYDWADRLESWNDGTATTPYAYDDAGNRTRVGADVYTYDARNQLTSDGHTSYKYSARGTLSQRTVNAVATDVRFDAYGQLVQDGTSTYRYDATGRTLTAGSSTFQFSGTENTPSFDGSNSYTYDPSGALIGIGTGTPGSGVVAYTDVHTDVVGQFTWNGSVLAGKKVYDPLGNLKSSSGDIGKVGFQSGWTDPATSRVNMAARWYDPAAGVFASQDTIDIDPVPNPNAANKHAYVDGNPLTRTDPSGHGWWGDLTSSVSSAWSSVKSAATTAYRWVNTNVVQPIRRAVSSWVNSVSDSWRSTVDSVRDTAQRVTNTVKQTWNNAKSAVSTAYNKTVEVVKPWVQKHSSTIASIAVGVVAFAGCTALTAGVGAIGCAALAGAAANAVAYGMDCGKKGGSCSAGGLAAAVGLGALGGALGGALAGPLGGRLVSAALEGVLPKVAINTLVGVGVGGISGGAVGGVQYGLSCGSSQDGCSLAGAAVAVGTGALAGAALGAAAGAAGGAWQSIRNRSSSTSSPVGETPAVGKGTQKDRSTSSDKCHSFTGSTPVLMADGSTKSIDQIRRGDLVANAMPGETEARPDRVAEVIVTTTDSEFIDVTVRVGDGLDSTATVTTTNTHPFYNITKDAFVEAVDLEAGDQLQTVAGGTVTVVSVRPYLDDEVTYDLTIRGLHTYYVLAGTTPVLVHNCELSDRARQIWGAETDEWARKTTTVAVVRVQTPQGQADLIAGSGPGLTAPQASVPLRPGEMHVPNVPGVHAEINALLYAKVMGYQYIAGGASRNVCNSCAKTLREEGGRLMGLVYAGNGKTTTRQRSFEWPW